MHINLPTWLTLFRVALLPVMVLVFYLPFTGHNITAAIVFVLAAVTDWLDGYLARRRKQVTALGQLMDDQGAIAVEPENSAHPLLDRRTAWTSPARGRPRS